MRMISVALIALLLVAPGIAGAQGIAVHAAGGPTLGDSGYSLVAGIGFSPTPRVAILLTAERSHLVGRRQESPNSVSYFRGGTLTLASAELQVSILERAGISPYALVGFGVGRSRPNVNDIFPTPLVLTVRAPFAGGGVQVPLGQRVRLFADLRLALVVGTESDDLYALAPLRAGLSWRF